MAAFRRADLVVETKPDLTPVTQADREVELHARDALALQRPGDRILGEEFGGQADKLGRRWIIDPIDGTKNFVRNIPVWATLLALEVDGQIAVGVVSAPALGRRWWAARGRGAFAGPAGAAGPARAAGAAKGPVGTGRIRVSKVERLEDAQLSSGGAEGWEAHGGPERALALARLCWRDRGFGDFWSHVLVAEGGCDIGLDPIVSIWDLAALQVIVEEAGGRFTDLEGVARPDGGSAISSNGYLHDAALAVLRGA
jgi:histidinol-phosphatase